MKFRVLAISIMAGLLAHRAIAQPASPCDDCVAASRCDATQDACVAECRAHYFSIDPKRASCTAQCGAEAASCKDTVKSYCRARNRCPPMGQRDNGARVRLAGWPPAGSLAAPVVLYPG